MCFPDKPFVVHDFVAQVCHPPVPEIAHVPISIPVTLSSLISMLPPAFALATLAEKLVAPFPKSILSYTR